MRNLQVEMKLSCEIIIFLKHSSVSGHFVIIIRIALFLMLSINGFLLEETLLFHSNAKINKCKFMYQSAVLVHVIMKWITLELISFEITLWV